MIGEGRNFVRTMAELAAKGVKPSVVDDQYGRLTFTSTLAAGIVHLLTTGAPYGTYNLTNDGPTASWHELARAVYAAVGRDADDVSPVSTVEYGQGKELAPRPQHSTLDLGRIIATGFHPEDWRDLLAAYLEANNLRGN